MGTGGGRKRRGRLQPTMPVRASVVVAAYNEGDLLWKTVQAIRAFYPIIFYSFLYTETHHLDGLFCQRYLDGFFVDLDQRLFGQQLCRTMMWANPQTWLR